MSKGLNAALATVFACGFIYCVGDDPTSSSSTDADAGGGGSSSGGSSSGASGSGGIDAGDDGDTADAALAPLTTSPSVAVGFGQSCVLRPSGHVYCWGSNTVGQLGRGTENAGSPTPGEVNIITTAARLVVGNQNACALLRDHTVWCWGSNALGQCAQPIATKTVPTPTQVSGLTDVVEISAGMSHVCARKADKSVWCWGANGSDALGYANTSDAACLSTKCNPKPTKVANLAADAIALGLGHSCARVGKKALCWGANDQSQLGHLAGQGGDVNDGGSWKNPTPIEASAFNVEALFAHGNTTCLINGTGKVFCWGGNDSGQLGDLGAVASSANGVAVTGLPTPAVKVAPGWKDTCAVQNNDVYCWGADMLGSLGADAGATTKAPATRITAWEASTQVDVASTHPGSHHCALFANGAVWCWGSNNFGEIGHASAGDPDCGGAKCSVPTVVNGLP